MADVLNKHFIVVSDPFSAQNNTSFGVRMWVFNPAGEEIREYWYGTGNCLIGRVFTEEYHRKRVKGVSQMLAEARQIQAGELKAAAEVQGTIKSVDADKGVVLITRGFGKDARDEEFTIGPHTRIVDGLIELKEPVLLKEGLKSDLVAAGAAVKLATLTDKDGTLKVKEVEIRGRPRLK